MGIHACVELHEPKSHSAPCDRACDGRGRVSLDIHLLGSPVIERGGVAVQPPRGHKPWGLLAYLVRTRVAPSRERVARLLFSEADDPLGALRNTLTALRRLLGDDVGLGGNPLRLRLPPGTVLDVEVLSRGSWIEAVALRGLGLELLEGLVFRSSPGFEIWLEDERRHVAGTTAAALRQAALARLAHGDPRAAAAHASALVELNRFDENAYALLVRSLHAAGDHDAAERQAAACVELFQRELGIEPTPAVHAGLAHGAAAARAAPLGEAAVLALIETGEAIIAAGATDAGLERLRVACAAAREGAGGELLARSLIALGGALVHGARGTDVEGAAALHEGVVLAESAGKHELAATAWREISWVQFLRAEYERAEQSLSRAAELAGTNMEELAWVDLIRGTCHFDMGEHARAGPLLASAVTRSREIAPAQPLALALTTLARFHLSRGEVETAQLVLDEALELVDVRGLTAFRPWPESFRAEIDLLRGDVDAAEMRFEHAFAVGCEVGDPCWESIATRGLGLVAASRGDTARALELLADAPRRCRRLPDTYLWIEAYGLDALCAVALEHDVASTALWISELESITARRGMRELLLRVMLYRVKMGDAGAMEAARSLAAEIDNPAISELLDAAALAHA